MTTAYLIHATGLAALALTISGMLRTCDTALRAKSGFAAMLWALNNMLIGAETAAMLSLVSVGRQATSVLTQRQTDRIRRIAFLAFVMVTVAAGAFTWQGWPTLVMTGASTGSTYAMFYLHGRRLRLSMIVISALWMYNAWTHDSWEQMAGNVLTATASLYGAWRLGREELQSEAAVG